MVWNSSRCFHVLSRQIVLDSGKRVVYEMCLYPWPASNKFKIMVPRVFSLVSSNMLPVMATSMGQSLHLQCDVARAHSEPRTNPHILNLAKLNFSMARFRQQWQDGSHRQVSRPKPVFSRLLRTAAPQSTWILISARGMDESSWLRKRIHGSYCELRRPCVGISSVGTY
ncbi:hypothetical protein BDV95DRAFT_187466 [Massariosphaeria phaeospora]|uniref:Uncharacterized protein n=1 Tax=Massariosphaeria phaeospora TaxID=100035 RepID=A0A7C8I3S0_9PLEO|nr:hypothetical protein BDV95DRAFT_187466 [Massariosphaeria phaeospora]